MASMERFTQRARRVLALAHEEAEKARKETLGTEDLLLGLLVEEGGVAGRVLRELGLDVERVREIINRVTQDGRRSETDGRVNLDADTQKVLEYSIDEARGFGHHYIGTEHLLLALTRSEGTVKDVFDKLGLTPDQIRKEVRRILNEGSSRTSSRAQSRTPRRTSRPATPQKQDKTPLIDQLATDLTNLAEEGKLDPVIGRQTEIERVIQILARRTKNNPALIGEPGVGKTAIVEGLAQRIVEGDVPAPLMKKQVLQLDVGSLVAGTMYRGQFEERLKRVIDELKKSGAILFIDEVHMLVGAGSAGSSMDAANILKPALSRGELQVIGATTMEEYRKNIEADAALERRFQSILVEEPSEEETVAILKGIRKAYEDHHHLVISDEALESATQLSARYISERFLPDKAIDLIDESASRVRMYKSPTAKKAKDLFAQLRETKENRNLIQEEGEEEKLQELDNALAKLEEEIEKLRTGWDRADSPTVSAEDIAEMVSMWTGVPLMQLAQEESERLLQMEAELRQHIIGQDEAIETIARAVRRARAGLKDPQRPIGSLMFLGPTGVGKTELTKALAKFMFGSEDAAIQLDMSEFMERHTASRLVGAPPGYVGYDDAGQLTEALRRRPYSIVVFDEIEKAHGEVHNMLLQIMEEGHLSDARGRKVDFSNAIIVMTSNVGADMIKKQGSFGFQLKQDKETEERLGYEDMRKQLTETLKRVFRPEFINRLDGVVVFRSLNEENIQSIVTLELDKLTERLSDHGLTLTATPVALTQLGEMGYDAEMGARPLKRVIQQYVEDPLSDAVLAGDFVDGDTVLVDLDDGGEIILTKALDTVNETDAEPVV
jgi:ATP-dependent Clp protease ATP-binding subunit ClpC